MTTIYDVAEYCGVSVSTVSRAIAAPDMVRQSTRRRVLEAVDKLGYQPNRVARALSTGRTRSIGFVVPSLANPFFPRVLKAAQGAARSLDFAVLVGDTDEDPDAEAELITTMGRQVDGVVVCAPRLADKDILRLAREVKIVCVNRPVRGVPGVLMDSAAGVSEAARYLHGLGHQRFVYVNGPERSWSNGERRGALGAEAERLGFEVHELGPVSAKFEDGVALAPEIARMGVSAVMAYNDLIALGVLAGLRQTGVEVPGQISVVGVDDIMMAAMSTPALSTVSVAKDEAGAAAVELLLEVLEGERRGPARTLRCPPTFVRRQSTGPAPA
ncbi:MAG TPA: LacI family DNA-binding transcriptional regulator [Acidimicrobiales bacterium]|nr:LacI family DNA-binding transcriptional regulator [Acidimicrobiales bacterium]